MCAVQARARLAVTVVTTGLLFVALVGCSDGASSVDEAAAGSRAAAGAGVSPGPAGSTPDPTGPGTSAADGSGQAGGTISTAPDGASGTQGAGAGAGGTRTSGVDGSPGPATPQASAAPDAPAGGGASPSAAGGLPAAGGGGSSGAVEPGAATSSGPAAPVPLPSAVFLGEACNPRRNTGPAAAINGLALYCAPDESSGAGGRWSTEAPSSTPTRPRQGNICEQADVGRIVPDASGRPLTCLQDPTGSLSWSDVS
ncbi:hypothetical protein MXD59_04690 [Frankia sp. Ag45/Mut15]|uniref:Uncharacterized protein n=1 Tax=Frankia umida TaxID=573489 RepID=A0ABT0JU55_9ACTN|nr:hypothetical protein [Frankia umida]MCK9875087.1 hypothetical protein [Frankia umida]